ncbi:uncharacterized protein [Eucyclogobius newberryi]|uniref:uncharacterized protein isoform X2 n=1 Tax=Eucyclogobius newberryi TaxID=166745 RepID=UPI003B5A385D
MRRRRKPRDLHRETSSKLEYWKWEMFLIPRWWILVVYLSAVLPRCSSVNVFVRDEKRYAVLFQSVVLPCQYNSVSTQTPVVQWVYKSYCRDRTRDSFSFTDTLGAGGVANTGYNNHGGYGSQGSYGGTYETGTVSYLDCADSSRTVRTVASVSGSSITLSEHYKNRDISIINKADLRIGEVQWGDSGVYMCKVIISDDLEGQNEASVELLVLGLSAVPEDLLPGFDLKIMPEWVFVGAVALGSVLFLLLVGICWCQCCPHSCCCYVSCWCCPDTCCCPRHLYEAGKGIKTGPSTPVYPPYFVSGVPAMVPIAPPSLVDKSSVSVPPSDATLVTVPVHAVSTSYRVPSVQDQNSLMVLQYVEKQLAHFNPAMSSSHHSSSASELSSLHEGENNFRKTFRNVQKKALPAIIDVDLKPEPELQRPHGNLPSPQRYHDNPTSPRRHHDNPQSPPRRRDSPSSPQRDQNKLSSPQHYRHRLPSPQRYRDNPPSSEHHRDSPASSHRFQDNAPRHYQKKTPSPQRHRKDPPSLQRYRKDPPSPKRYRDEPDSETFFRQHKPLLQRRFSDEPPAPTQSRRPEAKPQPDHREPDQHRWNPRSEHLQRKAYRSGERAVSLDELEEFAFSYSQRQGRGTERGAEERTNYELQGSSQHDTYHNGLTQHYHTNDNHPEHTSDYDDYPRRKNRRDISPLASPIKRRGTWDPDCPAPPPPNVSPPSSSSQEKDYDPTFLNNLLERKAKLRGVSQEKGTSRGDGGSDTPSKSSCNQGSGETHRHSPNNRPDGDSLLYSEINRNQSPSWRPGPGNSGSSQSSALAQPGRRDETREKPRKMNTLLSRDSLIV